MLRVLPLVLLVGCASTTARFRDVEGRPLASHARLDADVAPLEVHCPGTGSYMILDAPRPYLAGTRLGTHRPFVRDAAYLCARIAAN